MTISTDEIRDIAAQIVHDYLDDGVEFITVAETAEEYAGSDSDLSDDDLRAIHGDTRVIITQIIAKMFTETEE